MSVMDNSGIPYPVEDVFCGEDYRPEERGKRMFLVGGPFGPLDPMGIFPIYGPEEEKDPNP